MSAGAFAALAALGLPQRARAQWPARPIRLVVPSAAGGSPDVVCRILAAELSKSLGQQVIVDNKPGAASTIGTVEVVRAEPDGHTLGYANVVTLAINRSLLAKLPYDPDTQLVPIGLIGHVQNALVVRPDLPAKTVRDLIDHARARPGKLVVGSPGNGTTGHLGAELFKSMTGTFILHVPYRGSPAAIQDLIGGQVDLLFDNLSSILPHIKSGRVRALGVSGAARSPLLPDVPTLDEAGVRGYRTEGWGGLVAPAGTPAPIIERLNREMNTVLASPAVIERYAALSFELTPGPPAALFERARRETPMWAEVIKRAGAKID
jgi:tripartite-type tricarboxylate transporter receptor subunit TctC